MVGRIATLLYGTLTYVCFLATFVYAAGFVSGFMTPTALDSGANAPLLPALLINIALLGLFGLQHSVMARPGFKRMWTKIVPQPIERSTFVLFTCVILGAIFTLWQPLTGVVWQVDNPVWKTVIWSIAAFGWLVVLLSTFIIDHFELFGLKQVVLHALGKPFRHPEFKVTGFYRYVRHPLMFGFIVAFWATPLMTISHLVFAAVTTAYVLVAIQLEERDLVRFHPEKYPEYQRRVPMLIPFFGKKRAPAASVPAPVESQAA